MAPRPFEVQIVPQRDPSATQLAELHRLLYVNWLSPTLRNNIRHVPRSSHTNWLGELEARIERGIESGELSPRPDGLPYGTPVPSSSPVMGIVQTHWLERALALLWESRRDFAPWFGAFGVQLVPPTAPLADLLRAPCDFPLFEAGRPRPFLVAAVHGDPTRIIVDEDLGPRSLGELSAAEMKTLRDLSGSGTCMCFLCQKLRAKLDARPGKPTKAPATTKAPAKKSPAKKSPAKKSPAKKSPAKR